MFINKFKHTLLKTVLAVLLLLAFLFQVVNRAVYAHSHVLADGTIIIHAHPYDKTNSHSPVTNHKHTVNELLLLALSSLLFFYFSISFFRLFKKITKFFPGIKQSFHPFLAYTSLNNKSPPFIA